MKNDVSNRDLELLSAYLDKELNPKERAHVEARLDSNPELRQVLGELHQNRAALRSLPRLRAPRNFTLSPQIAGIKPQKRAYPVFGLVSALSTLVLILVLVGDFLVPPAMTSQRMAEQAAPQAVEVNPTLEMEILSELKTEESLETESPEEPLAAMIEEETGETPQSKEMGIEGGTETPTEETQIGIDIFSSKIPQATSTYPTPENTATPSPTSTSPSPTNTPTIPIPTATIKSETDKLIESVVPSTPITIESQSPSSGLPFSRILEISLALIALLTGSAALYLRFRNQ